MSEIANLVDSFWGSNLTSIAIDNATLFSLSNFFALSCFFVCLFYFFPTVSRRKMAFICKKMKEQFTNTTIHSFYTFFYYYSFFQATKYGFQVHLCCFVAVRDISIFPSQAPQKRKKHEKGYGFTLSSLILK